VSHPEDHKLTAIFKHFRAVYKLYQNRGLKINLLLVGGEFAALQALVHVMEQAPRVNLTSAHPRSRTTYSCCQGKGSGFPARSAISTLTKIAYHAYGYGLCEAHKYFPTKGGLFISPRLLMTGVGLESIKHFRVPFGSYCQVHEDDKPI
jgi:hypothetical protein